MVIEGQLTINSKKFLKDIDKLKRAFPETAYRVATEFANESRKEGVQGIIPVVTGNLRSTARVVSGGVSSIMAAATIQKGVKFVTGGIMGRGNPPLFVDYATYVAYGTSRQTAQFFMERSVNVASRNFDRFSKVALDSWLAHMK